MRPAATNCIQIRYLLSYASVVIIVQDHISISAGFVTLTSALVIGIVNGLVILKLGHTETFCLRSLIR